jgi:hypothetical protein
LKFNCIFVVIVYDPYIFCNAIDRSWAAASSRMAIERTPMQPHCSGALN